MSTINQQSKLRERLTGIPEPETFSAHESPVVSPQDGDVLLETLFLSVDPARRVWIGDNPG